MKIIYHFLLILLTGIILISSAKSATYYVNSNGGNDNNSPVQARNIATPWLTVQHAIDNGSVLNGDNIVVAEGTYAGFTLNKRLNIIGVWKASNPATNTIFNSTVTLNAPGGSPTDRMFLKNLRVASTSGDAIDLRASYLTLENVFATATTVNGVNGLRINSNNIKDIQLEACNFNASTYSGIYIPSFVDIDGFIMRNSTVSNNGYFGIVAFQTRTNPTEIKNVEISHCAFVDNNPTNQYQGHTIYFEKLKNSVFENISVKMPTGNIWIGIDINLLSRQDYTNISILNSQIIRDTPGSGIWIQARNDLFDPPAALDTVVLRGLTFTNCDTNIAFNRQVKRMVVDKCDLSTYSVYGLVNYTDQDGEIIASNNKWQNGGTPDTTVISGGILEIGNPIISFMPSTNGIFVGMGIQGTGVPPGTTVIGVSPNTVTMSNAATVSDFIPSIGFAFNFNTSTDIVRTSLNFVRCGNPLPNSIINDQNVSFPTLAAAITGSTSGGTIWNVPSGTIAGTTNIDRNLTLIGPGAGQLHAPSLTTFDNLNVTAAFLMGSDFAITNVFTPGDTYIEQFYFNNTLIINGSVTPGGAMYGGSQSDLLVGGAGPSTTLPIAVNGLRTLQLNRANGVAVDPAGISLFRLLFLQNGVLALNGIADIVLRANATIFNPSPATSYVGTFGTGALTKRFDAFSPTFFNFPVGNGAASPASVFFSTFVPGLNGRFSVRTVNTKHPENGCPTDYLNRYWSASQNNMNGSVADMRFGYDVGDVVGTEANIIGARWNGFLWDAFTPVNTVTHSFTANNINTFGDFTGGASGCIGNSNTAINVKIFLEGAYAGSNSMRTDLFDNGIIPLTQPYAGSQFNYNGTESVTSIPAGVVDWVYLEIRTTANGSPVLNGKRAAFLKSDGTIVDLDGVSTVKIPSVIPGNYFIIVGHRNHLPIMSTSAQPLSTASVQYDFTSGLGQYFGGDAKNLGGVFGAYAGDANKTFLISAADYQIVTSNLLQTNYNQGDLNLSAIVSAADYAFITNNLTKTSNVPNYQ